MGFTDRPIVTAGLGIAFALILLAVLSSPTLLGNVSNSPGSSGPIFGPASANLVASSSSETPLASSTATFTATQAETHSGAQSAGNSTVSSGTGYPYSSSSATGTGTATAYENLTTMQNSTTTISTVSSASNQSVTTETPPNTGAITTETTITQGGTMLTTVPSNGATQAGMALVNRYSSAFSTKSLLGSLGVLSALSLAIALGSMFYVRRKINSDQEEK